MDEEHIHPNWMIIPVGNLAGAVTAMLVDEEYVEWGWFQFSLGSLLWLALWPTTFRKVREFTCIVGLGSQDGESALLGFGYVVVPEAARSWYCFRDLLSRHLPLRTWDMSLSLLPPPINSRIFAAKASITVLRSGSGVLTY